MLTINTWRNPYGNGFSATRLVKASFEEGISILIGCNGSGKTTLINNIKSEMNRAHIPCRLYNNLNALKNHNGFMFGIDEVVDSCCSSEGENIKARIVRESALYTEFIKSGTFNDKEHEMKESIRKMCGDILEDTAVNSNIRVLLFDGVDSGFSIDQIDEFKDMIECLYDIGKKDGKEMYIIISANTYEMCRHMNCFDLNRSKWIRFKDYYEYRDFVIKSREFKNKRILKQREYIKREKEKELVKFRKFNAKLKDGSIHSVFYRDNQNSAIREWIRTNCLFLTYEDIKDEI